MCYSCAIVMSGVCHVLQLCYCDVWCVSCATVVLLHSHIGRQNKLPITKFFPSSLEGISIWYVI
jgi:hypothetical protein